MRLNRLEEAGYWYRESLKAKPDHIPAHLTYGKLLSIIVCPFADTQTYTSSTDVLNIMIIPMVNKTEGLLL